MLNKMVPGQIVRSKAGRDMKRHFVILEVIDDEFCMIVDGDVRKVEKPKKKKFKHLSFLNDNALNDKDFSFTNKKLRALLKGYNDRGTTNLCQRRII